MTGTPTKRELAKEERRSQILEAALSVFSEKGYHTANVSDVAARAGVSQGTIYWYFESKEELFEASVLHKFERFGDDALAEVVGKPTATEKLVALSIGMEEFVADLEGLFMLFLSYWASKPDREEAGRWWLELLVQYKNLLAAIIQEGVAAGEFREVDAEALVWALMAAYDGLAAYDVFMPGLDLGQISRTFVDVLLHGLRVGGQGGE
jgi:AcrR family transcriptional regulator